MQRSNALWIIILIIVIILALIFYFKSCRNGDGRKDNEVSFSGTVVDHANKPLKDAAVQINDVKTQTDGDGKFAITVDTAHHYSLTARLDNFSSHAQIYHGPTTGLRIMLYPATVVSANPANDITVTDTLSRQRPGPAASHIQWSSERLARVPRVYENGKLVDFGFSPAMKQAFDYVRSRQQAGPGMTISIPANSLVRNGQAPSGNVNVSVSTIDLFTAGAMPGDMSVMRNGQRSGFMISFGAGSIEVYDEKGFYQLNEKARAKITIPIDTSILVFNKEIPQSVPLFYYNEKTGYWVEDGEARINASRTAYEAELRHFSTFNMDIEKTTPACVQVRHNPVGISTIPAYKVEAILTYNGNPIHQERTIKDPGPNSGIWPSVDPTPCLKSEAKTSTHMLYNLPDNTEICLLFYKVDTLGVAPDTVISIAITNTGATYGATLPTCPSDTCDTAGCPTNPNCTDPSCGYGTCSFVPFTRTMQPVLLARKKLTASSLRLKWVFDHAPASISYQVFEVADPTGTTVVGPVGPPTTINPAIDPLEPQSFDVTGIAAGTHFYKVVATVSGTDFESNVVEESF